MGYRLVRMATKQPRTIKADLQLQARIGTGKIDEKAVVAAQKVIDEDETDFTVLARPDLDALQKAIIAAKEDMSDGPAILDSIRHPIMNLKANAGSFKYDFVSQLTAMILTVLEKADEPDKKLIQAADVLHKTVLLALAYKMKGDGGQNGKALLQAFSVFCDKYQAG